MIEKKIIYQGVKIFYRKYGKGTPVLFLHGFGEDGTIFNALLPHLEKYATLLIPDLPGSGKSMTENGFDYSLEHLALVMKALLDQEGVSSCIILGHSMGGYIALAMAEQFPDLINGLGLIHSTAFADSVERKEKRNQGIKFIEQKGVSAFLQLSLPGLFSQKFRQNHPDIISSLVEKGSSSFTPTALIGYYKSMMQRPDRTHILSTLACPILLVIGGWDELIPAKDMQQQANLVKKPTVHLIPTAGHMSMLEASDELGNTLHQFICKATALS